MMPIRQRSPSLGGIQVSFRKGSTIECRGQFDNEARAAPGPITSRPNAAAMLFNERARNRKSKTQTAIQACHLRTPLLKAVEKLRTQLRPNTDASVGNLNAE